MNNSGWEGQFAQGFSSGGPDNGGWIWALVLGAFLVLAVLVYYQMDRARTRHPRPKTSHPTASTVTKIEMPQGRLNPLQHRALHEIIDAFREQEPAAQALPVAILEKYSEFLYENLKQLKTSDAEVKEFINSHYPLKEGYRAELDFHGAGVTQLIQSRVLEVGPRTVTVAFEGPSLPFVKRGAQLWLNYTVGRHFLQGATTIAEVGPQGGLVLRRPEQVTLTTERRYTRVPLSNVQGNLHDPKRGLKSVVKILDLSLEGVRVQVERPLERKNVHQLTFDVVVEGRPLNFGPIDCVPSKAFLNGIGTYEAGLVFLYLDLANRTKLSVYMKHLAQELQSRKAGQ